MHLFINTFITNQRFKPGAYKELTSKRAYSKLDVFKYAIKSYQSLPLEKASVFIELDDEFSSAESELFEYIRNTLRCKVSFCNKRIDKISKWKSAIRSLPENSIIFFTCNDDHIFTGTSLYDFEKHLNDFRVVYSRERYLSSAITHWQEMISHLALERLFNRAYPYDEFSKDVRPSFDNKNLSLQHSWVTNYRSSIGTQLITKELLMEIFSSESNFPIKDYRRSDEANPYGGSLRRLRWFTLIPKTEMFRHFDAYSHNGIPHSVVPPMFIPNHNPILCFGGRRVPGEVFCHPRKPLFIDDCRVEFRMSNFSDHYYFVKFPLVWGTVEKKFNGFFPEVEYYKYYLFCKSREILCQRSFGAGIVFVIKMFVAELSMVLSLSEITKTVILAAKSVRYNPFKNQIYLCRRYLGLFKRWSLRVLTFTSKT